MLTYAYTYMIYTCICTHSKQEPGMYAFCDELCTCVHYACSRLSLYVWPCPLPPMAQIRDLCVRMCACERVWERESVCVCKFVCVRIYQFMFMCVYVCLYVWACLHPPMAQIRDPCVHIVCMWTWERVCVSFHVCVCMHACLHPPMAQIRDLCVRIVCMCAWDVCKYVCMYCERVSER